LDDPLSNRHAQAGSLGLRGVERLENPAGLLGAQSRTVVADGHAQGRAAGQLRGAAADRDADRVAASSPGVLQDIAEHLLESKRVDCTLAVEHVAFLVKNGVATVPANEKVFPGLSPNRGHVPRLALELERSGVGANFLIELLQVVLGLLNPADQVEGFGP